MKKQTAADRMHERTGERRHLKHAKSAVKHGRDPMKKGLARHIPSVAKSNPYINSHHFTGSHHK